MTTNERSYSPKVKIRRQYVCSIHEDVKALHAESWAMGCADTHQEILLGGHTVVRVHLQATNGLSICDV